MAVITDHRSSFTLCFSWIEEKKKRNKISTIFQCQVQIHDQKEMVKCRVWEKSQQKSKEKKSWEKY